MIGENRRITATAVDIRHRWKCGMIRITRSSVVITIIIPRISIIIIIGITMIVILVILRTNSGTIRDTIDRRTIIDNTEPAAAVIIGSATIIPHAVVVRRRRLRTETTLLLLDRHPCPRILPLNNRSTPNINCCPRHTPTKSTIIPIPPHHCP